MGTGGWPIAVFAHNERDRIKRCLDSLFEGGLGRDLAIHVLVNGCTDDTESVVRGYAATSPAVTAHSIEIGDKANAWNVFVHEIAPEAAVHFFVDGDVRILPGSLLALRRALDASPHALAASALPDSGRNSGRWMDAVLHEHGLTGNCYALRGAFVRRMQGRATRLPVGLIGEDSWVGALAKADVDGTSGWDQNRIEVCLDARFHYESLRWYSPADLRLYWRRRFRYAQRTWQTLLLRHHWAKTGTCEMPAHIEDLYRSYPEQLALRWAGIDTFFLWRTRERIRETLAAK